MDAHKAMAADAFPDLPVVTMTKVMDAVSVMRCSCALHIDVPASVRTAWSGAPAHGKKKAAIGRLCWMPRRKAAHHFIR
ncbi:hypothetical protein [Pseudoxanthomonas kaohsiungensis]|uniref:Uncharacterized protein n=1 Tax=Pseudoxanthomonas kaohsiungensis TaxID=283923 RepID=A0ABW3LUC8_9GAMM|nr:hypothetical protein [Pseudoxanthomonas kaohsiungensis]